MTTDPNPELSANLTATRRALVTGASRGIGASTAQALSATGFDVTGTFNNTPPPTGVAANWWQIDLSNPENIASSGFDLSTFDVLVVNAGTMHTGFLQRTPLDAYRRMIDFTLLSAVELLRGTTTGMAKRRYGRIVLVSSTGAVSGAAGLSAYAAAKASLLGLSRAVAREYGPRGVTCNVVLPGFIATDILVGQPERTTSDRAATSAIGRVGTPDEVASAIAWLASESAGYVTGAQIPVDGGLAMGL